MAITRLGEFTGMSDINDKPIREGHRLKGLNRDFLVFWDYSKSGFFLDRSIILNEENIDIYQVRIK